jgi:protein-S-isoprenylcysteine O-methyltransferase Ste14
MARIPAFVSGCCLLIYWGAVGIKARRARRWKHGANVIPPERIGRWLRVVWVPLVIAWCVQPWLAFTRGAVEFRAVAYIGAAICVFATAATFVCWRAMGKSWRIGIDPAEETTLIVAGPFRTIRHPIYSLSVALMIGTLATTQTGLMFGIAVVHFVLLQWEAAREEAHLLQKHGDQYERYRSTTGRFLPRV